LFDLFNNTITAAITSEEKVEAKGGDSKFRPFLKVVHK
jgi:hypothetical protein